MTDDVKLENEEVEKTKIELIPKTSDMDKEFNWFDLIKCEYKINSICYEIYLPASFFKIHEFLSKDINIKDKGLHQLEGTAKEIRLQEYQLKLKHLLDKKETLLNLKNQFHINNKDK